MMLSFTKLRALTLNDQAVSQSPTPSEKVESGANLFLPQKGTKTQNDFLSFMPFVLCDCVLEYVTKLLSKLFYLLLSWIVLS